MAVSSTAEIAKKVRSYLRRKKLDSPNIDILENLFQILFNCSLKTEESQPIKFHIIYMDPSAIEREFPPEPREDFWQVIHLVEILEFNTRNLVKISGATDPRSSSIAVYCTDNKIFIWGFVDQANSYYSFVNFEEEGGYDRPGLFHASILGIGHIVAYKDTEKIAELKQERLITSATSPFTSSPLSSLLDSTEESG